MLSKTLIVCLLAFLCLNVATAERLNTRIAGGDSASQGQFPYIAFLTYNYQNAAGVLTSQQFTGIIYSKNSIITTASNFDNFPILGATLTIEVGAWDINNPIASFQYAATVGTYDLEDSTATDPSTLIIIPTQYTQGQATYNVAIVKLDAADVFTFGAEVAIANFPTSSPIPSEVLYTVAYGNQVADGATFPILKYAQLLMKEANLCQTSLVAAGLSADFYDRSQHFCVQSQAVEQTDGVFEGVCSLDVGGAVVRTANPDDTTNYYEVVGLLAYAGDTTSCDPTTRVPAVIVYLSVFQESFFTPILESLLDAGNGQDATQNTNSFRGNFICGNGVVDGVERCDPADPTTELCCSENTCNFKPAGKLCGSAKKGDTPDKCVTKTICDNSGVCAARNKREGRSCDSAGSVCTAGVCGSA